MFSFSHLTNCADPDEVLKGVEPGRNEKKNLKRKAGRRRGAMMGNGLVRRLTG